MRYYTRKVKTYKPGDIIFSENSECDGMYLIDSGKVRVYKTVKSPDAGTKEIELCTLGAKSMFGEMAMIDESRRSATVEAVEPTSCTVITKKIFEDQLSHIPGWMVNMIRILVQRLRDTNEKLRVHIQDHTPLPEDDTGILMVNPDEKKEREPKPAPAAGKKEQGRLSPDEIIKDLFSSTQE